MKILRYVRRSRFEVEFFKQNGKYSLEFIRRKKDKFENEFLQRVFE